MDKKILILGTRGIPASHGGFETFAEHLSLYLLKHGWEVVVYCQIDGKGSNYEDNWNGIRRINVPINNDGAVGTIIFDLKSSLDAMKKNSLILTLGYNTAIFSILYRLSNKINIINMDGIEWKREKWSTLERMWLYINERMGCILGNKLIADHPEIKKHLATRVSESKITMIPYGSNEITSGDPGILEQLNLEPYNYALVIARPEPENSILEIVRAFSSKVRNKKLVVLGNFNKGNTEYCASVIKFASNEVVFPGAIYDQTTVQSLRYYTQLYIHGHQVGGTNPSLVEALGAGNAILAHDNEFNRWVAGVDNVYFDSWETCSLKLDELLDDDNILTKMRDSSTKIHKRMFTWDIILKKYESFLSLNINHQ